jgi:hypothetical protein
MLKPESTKPESKHTLFVAKIFIFYNKIIIINKQLINSETEK